MSFNAENFYHLSRKVTADKQNRQKSIPYWTPIKTTAERWHVSRTIIYRYLDKIEKGGEEVTFQTNNKRIR